MRIIKLFNQIDIRFILDFNANYMKTANIGNIIDLFVERFCIHV